MLKMSAQALYKLQSTGGKVFTGIYRYYEMSLQMRKEFLVLSFFSSSVTVDLLLLLLPRGEVTLALANAEVLPML